MAVIKNAIDVALQATSPRIVAASLPGNIDISSKLSGSGVNINNPRYCTFEEASLPPLTITNGTTGQSTTAYFGSKSLQLTATANDCYCFLGATNSDYNVNITPNKKWIASFFVYCTSIIDISNSASVGVELFVKTNSAGAHYKIWNAAIIPANTWTRISGLIDLSADASNKLIVRVDNNQSGLTVVYDGIMLEAQVGSQVTASTYQEPSNFLNTYTGTLDATTNTGSFANLVGKLTPANYLSYMANGAISVLGFAQNQVVNTTPISTSISFDSNGANVMAIISGRLAGGASAGAADGGVRMDFSFVVNGVTVYADQAARIISGVNASFGMGTYSVPILIPSPGAGVITYTLTITLVTSGSTTGALIGWPTIQLVGLKV